MTLINYTMAGLLGAFLALGLFAAKHSTSGAADQITPVVDIAHKA